MLRFILSRLFGASVVVLGVVCLVFLLLHLVPGDPVDVMLGEAAQPADREVLRQQLELDLPLPVQLGHYLQRLSRLDFGESLHSKRPILTLIQERMPATAQLAVAALAIAMIIAFPLGIIAAVRHQTVWDYGAMTFALLGVSVPSFWMGPLLVLVFALWLGWLPVSGQQEPGAIILPALTLGLAMAAILSRMVRSSLLEVMTEDYLKTARAKGLPEYRVILHHALRNALLPVITLLGLQLGVLLAGAVITETIFDWPGLGSLTLEAINKRDYPVVQACILVISVSYVVINVLTDLVYAWLDPRVRLDEDK